MKYGLKSIEQQKKDIKRLEADVIDVEIVLAIKKLALLTQKSVLIKSEIEAEDDVRV